MKKYLIEKVLEFKGENQFHYGNDETTAKLFSKSVKFFNDYGVTVIENDNSNERPPFAIIKVTTNADNDFVACEGLNIIRTSVGGLIHLYKSLNSIDGMFMIRAWANAIVAHSADIVIINNHISAKYETNPNVRIVIINNHISVKDETNPNVRKALDFDILSYFNELCRQNNIDVPMNTIKQILIVFRILGGYDGFRSIFNDIINESLYMIDNNCDELHYGISECLSCKYCSWDDDWNRVCSKYIYSIQSDLTAAEIPDNYPDAKVINGYLMSHYTPFGMTNCDGYQSRYKPQCHVEKSINNNSNNKMPQHVAVDADCCNMFERSFNIDVK